MWFRVFAAAAAFVCLTAGDAIAFDYHEHRAMTTRGLRRVLDASSTASATDPTATLRAYLTDFYSQIHTEANATGTRVCPTLGAFLSENATPSDRLRGDPHSCFDMADLPSLAGDHSSGPLNLVNRWFTQDTHPGSQFGDNIIEGAAHAGRIGSSPVVCLDTPEGADANPESLLSAVRRPGGPENTPLMEADQAYLCLAAHNAHHFRLARVGPVAAAELPLESAPSAYAFFHLRAIAYGRAAGTLTDPAKASALRAYAVLLELYSLHFVEDMIAGGHVASNRLELNPGSSMLTHNDHDDDGVVLRVGPDLRAQLQAALVGQDQLPNPPDAAITYTSFGDGQLTGVLAVEDCSQIHGDDVAVRANRDRCRTLTVGTALVARSLEEFARATVSRLDSVFARCVPSLVECSQRAPTTSTWPWLGAVARCEEQKRVSGEASCGTTELAQAANDAQLLEVLRLMPEPLEWPRTFYAPGIGGMSRYSGRAGFSAGLGAPGYRMGVEAGLGVYQFLPPGALGTNFRSMTQVFVGMEGWVRGEQCLYGCTMPFARRFGGADLTGGVSWAHWMLGFSFGGDVALMSSFDGIAPLRAGLHGGVDLAHRIDTRDTYALAWNLSARVGGILNEDDLYVGLNLGFIIEHPTSRAVPSGYSPRRGTTPTSWTDPHDRAVAYYQGMY